MKHVDSLKVIWNDREVGRLGLTPRGLSAFEYSESFLRDGVSISPFELPLRKEVFIARPTPFSGGFGVFDDSMPDGWGLLIQDRFLQSKGINPSSLTLLDRLALVGNTGRGALEFVPDLSEKEKDERLSLEYLYRESKKILGDSRYTGKGVLEFQERGGSPGGARPKVNLEFEGKDWLVKFPAHTDPREIGKIEYEFSLLAKKCGVEMPETRLFEDRYFGVERFDRTPHGKLHVISVSGLLRADYRIPSIDYSHIFQAASLLTKDALDILKIYRLMVFNYLIGNKDDHAKNFSFIYKDDKWHFSPAYDLLPSDGINGYHTTTINDKLMPGKEDLIALGIKFGLTPQTADTEYEFINDKIKENGSVKL